jgi:hypothetical protein
MVRERFDMDVIIDVNVSRREAGALWTNLTLFVPSMSGSVWIAATNCCLSLRLNTLGLVLCRSLFLR